MGYNLLALTPLLSQYTTEIGHAHREHWFGLERSFCLSPEILALFSHSSNSGMSSVFNVGCGFSLCKSRLTGCQAFQNIIINSFHIYLKDIITGSFREVGGVLRPTCLLLNPQPKRQFSALSGRPWKKLFLNSRIRDWILHMRVTQLGKAVEVARWSAERGGR